MFKYLEDISFGLGSMRSINLKPFLNNGSNLFDKLGNEVNFGLLYSDIIPNGLFLLPNLGVSQKL